LTKSGYGTTWVFFCISMLVLHYYIVVGLWGSLPPSFSAFCMEKKKMSRQMWETTHGFLCHPRLTCSPQWLCPTPTIWTNNMEKGKGGGAEIRRDSFHVTMSVSCIFPVFVLSPCSMLTAPTLSPFVISQVALMQMTFYTISNRIYLFFFFF
jgi:hypothetical protein